MPHNAFFTRNDHVIYEAEIPACWELQGFGSTKLGAGLRRLFNRWGKADMFEPRTQLVISGALAEVAFKLWADDQRDQGRVPDMSFDYVYFRNLRAPAGVFAEPDLRVTRETFLDLCGMKPDHLNGGFFTAPPYKPA